MLYENVLADEIPQMQELRLICSYAFAISEQNADNGTIVTAPTCGSCGVLPSALRYMQGKYNYSDDEIRPRPWRSPGLIGNLIKRNASHFRRGVRLQAEIGSACSMAAAALCTLKGLEIPQVEYAAENALEHHLGLTCDPI